MARCGAKRLVAALALLCTPWVWACENGARPTAPVAHEAPHEAPPRVANAAPSTVVPAPVASASASGSALAEPVAPEPAAVGWPPLTEPDEPRDFCTPRVHMLDADACFVLPERRTDTLLIYLHGIVAPTRESPQKTNLEAVVANAAERAGVVALLPRGERGFAPRQYPGWWGWPTSKTSYARNGTRFIEKIEAKRRLLEARLQQHFTRVYLAGSSSGAYFVAAVALHGDMSEVDGFGVLSGGVGYATDELTNLPKTPVYVGFGKNDSVAGGARALAHRLEALGWPVEVAPHPVPHGAREIYLDEAFAFWQRQQKN